MFELLKQDAGSRARLGRVHTTRGTIETPAFMPVGTQGSVKALLGSNATIDEVILDQGALSTRPTGLTASQGTSTTSVTLSWSATAGADSYKLFRNARQVVMNTNFFRKAGQTGFDQQGLRVEGDFENSGRWEVYSLSVQVPRQ